MKTNKEIANYVGRFLDFDGNMVERPDPSKQLLVVAGPWETMPVGAMQDKCRICKRLVGLAPRSVEMQQNGQVFMVLCRKCWRAFHHWRRGDKEAMLNEILHGED